MATVPSQITWVVGQVVTAAQLNSNVRDAVNYLLSPPLAVLRQTVAQSIANVNWTSITFDVEDIDRDNGHSTVSNTSRYTAQTAGWYALFGVVHYAPNSSNRRLSRWAVNGSALNASFSSVMAMTSGGGSTAVVAVPRRAFLNVGDYAELQGYQDSTVTLNTSTGSENASYMGVQWCSS